MHIAQMRENDIPFAVSLTNHEGWGNLPADFARILALNPHESFVAWENEGPIGIITSCIYGDHAFLGDLIVLPGHRRKGIGEALMRQVVDHVRGRGVTSIELDGTFAAVPLYRRLGFQDKYLSMRFTRPGGEQTLVRRPAAEFSLQEVISLDRRLTGLDHSTLLSRFLEEFKDSAYIERENGRLAGYTVVCPRADGAHAIGPLVAESADTAESLLVAAINEFGHAPLVIGLLQPIYPFTEILLRYHFSYGPPSLRMFLGQRRNYEKYMYGIISADMG